MNTSTVDSVAQLIDELRTMKSPGEVLSAAQSGLRQFEQSGLLHFFAGRALSQLGRAEEAIAHLEQARRLAPKHHWTCYELARAHALAGRFDLAVEALTAFLGQHSMPLGQIQVDWAQKILDREFESGRRHGLATQYRRLLELGDGRYLTTLRAFEGAVEANDLEGAGRILPLLGDPRDAWGQLAVARYHAKLPDHESDAARHALLAADLAPEQPVVALASTELLVRSQPPAMWRERLHRWAGALAKPDHALLELVAAVREPALLPDLALACQSQWVHRWHVIPYLYQAGDRLPEDRAALYTALIERFGADPDLLMCLANLEVGRRRFGEARRLCLDGLASAETAKQRGDFEFKLFELACFTHDLAEAAQRLEQIDVASLDSMQRAAVARFHAEKKDWTQAMAVLHPLLQDPSALTTDQALLIVRASRQTKGQYAALQAMGQEAHKSDVSAHLASALYEDWALAVDTSPEQAAAVARDLRVQTSPLLGFKLEALAPDKSLVLRGAAGTVKTPRRAVFFCADKAYAMPALVSLCSLLSNNAGFANADHFLVVDDELKDEAVRASEPVAAHFGVNLQVQLASELVGDRARLASGYGLFTGGQQLAAAAYYRIYMARRLAGSGRYDQVLYIDSDTLIGPGFDAILKEPVPDGALLMARLEVDRAEVRQAIQRHGLLAGMYFNSGVLWFPHVDDSLLSRLDAAVEAAEQRPHDLLFQDQCALNIGFAGAFAPLPERYNFFAGPHDEARVRETPLAEVSMLHVLDRPKPWDSAYPRHSTIQARWLHGAYALQRIIGPAALRPLLTHTVN